MSEQVMIDNGAEEVIGYGAWILEPKPEPIPGQVGPDEAVSPEEEEGALTSQSLTLASICAVLMLFLN